LSNKKSIFEKLGIIEKAEEKNEQSTEVEREVLEGESANQPSDQKQDDILKLNKLLGIQEIYKKAGMISEGTSTVFIIDNFSKALPDNLPTAVKRQSVLNLISTSGMSIDNITKDGKGRLQELNVFLQAFSSKTDEAILKNETEIKKLTQKINDYKKVINDRKKLKQEQKAVIEYETQKIQSIILFIEGQQ